VREVPVPVALDAPQDAPWLRRAKGTMYFAIHPHGLHMAGRWVGLGYDDRIMTGWGSMAKTREAAEAVIERLNQDHEGINV
jgi:hypothetical protein